MLHRAPVACQGLGCMAGHSGSCVAVAPAAESSGTSSAPNIPSGRSRHPLPKFSTVCFSGGGGLTTGQENFSLSQTCVSQCSQTLDSFGMLRKRKALNWNVARLVFPFSCTRMELSVAHLCCARRSSVRAYMASVKHLLKSWSNGGICLAVGQLLFCPLIPSPCCHPWGWAEVLTQVPPAPTPW